MDQKYQNLKNLLDKSPVIEDAVYAVQHCTGQNMVYAVGGCGSSSCASQSQCGNSRASSSSRREPILSKLEVDSN